MTLYDQSQTLNKLATEFISIYEMNAFVDVQLFNFYQHLRVCIYAILYCRVIRFNSCLCYIYFIFYILCFGGGSKRRTCSICGIVVVEQLPTKSSKRAF